MGVNGQVKYPGDLQGAQRIAAPTVLRGAFSCRDLGQRVPIASARGHLCRSSDRREPVLVGAGPWWG